MRPGITEGELVDRALICELIHEYCRALDAMELDGLAALFTDDCLVDYGPVLQSNGAAALRRDLARMWRWARTAHHSSNIQVHFPDSDTARATSSVWAWHESPDGSTATMTGQYHDRLLRTPDGWRITYRRQVMTGSDAGFTVDINRFERRPDERPAAPL